VDAWWCYCTEPFEADWNGADKPEPEMRLHRNVEESKRYLDADYINAYSWLHSKVIYEVQRATTETKRVVNLTRSAYSGPQRYSAITWSGDTSASWNTLRRQIAAGLNFCVTGVPYWTFDIGAFFVKTIPKLWFWNGEYDDGCDNLGYCELYVRWFQLGAFLPLFRSHGTDTPREVWRFGEPGTPFYDTLVRFIQLRYRLIPYIYSLAGWVTHEHYTMLRLLAFDFATDETVHDIDDEFMFGPSFLVCPVTHPMYYDADSVPLNDCLRIKTVYLPDGIDWYDFWSGEKYASGQCIQVDAPLEIMPLFIRAGSIVPMASVVQHIGFEVDEEIELRIYPGRSGSFTFYRDAGDGYGYERGEFCTVSIEWNDESGTLVFSNQEGVFQGMPTETHFRIVIVSQSDGRGLGLNPVVTDGTAIRYTGGQIIVPVS